MCCDMIDMMQGTYCVDIWRYCLVDDQTHNTKPTNEYPPLHLFFIITITYTIHTSPYICVCYWIIRIAEVNSDRCYNIPSIAKEKKGTHTPVRNFSHGVNGAKQYPDPFIVRIHMTYISHKLVNYINKVQWCRCMCVTRWAHNIQIKST
jgi:hypothetical protein